MRLAREIDRLPGLASALGGADGGPPLGQKAALCISRIATPETHGRWIATAREVPLTQLQKVVNAARQGSGEPSTPEDRPAGETREPAGPAEGMQERGGRSAHDDPVDEDSFEERTQVRLDGPPEVRVAYDAARDLHAAIVGRDAGLEAFVEALFGEAASTGCELPEEIHARLLARWQRGGSNAVNAGSRPDHARPAMRLPSRAMANPLSG